MKWVLDRQILFIWYLGIVGKFRGIISLFWTLYNENDKNWPKIAIWENKVLNTTKWVLDFQILFIWYLEVVGKFRATNSMFWTLYKENDKNWPKISIWENNVPNTTKWVLDLQILFIWFLEVVGKFRAINSMFWTLYKQKDQNWPKIVILENKVLNTTKWVLDLQILFI